MAKGSIYRAFMNALRKHWRAELPYVRPLQEALGGMPRASSFYAGFAQPLDLHVFLWFQPEVGRFTINVVFSDDEYNPRPWYPPDERKKGRRFGEGPCRIAEFFPGDLDKWWHLKQDTRSIAPWRWRATNYADTKRIIQEAMQDVTQDVLAVLCALGFPEARHAIPGVGQDVGFLQSIIDDPKDDSIRAIYADWLEERGDPRGEYLRLDIAVSKMPFGQGYDLQLRKLMDLRKSLRKRSDRLWVAIVGRVPFQVH